MDPATFCRRIVGDLAIAECVVSSAPDLLAVVALDSKRYPFLLESSAGAAAQSRYDMLLAFPGAAIEIGDGRLGESFFDQFDVAAAQEGVAPVSGVPFIGGWFFYLGYEMAGRIEPSLTLPRAQDDIFPDALAVRCPAAIIHDRLNGTLQIVAEARDMTRVECMIDDLCRADSAVVGTPIKANWTQADCRVYEGQVDRARELIFAGDVFQVNLSRAWHGELAQDTSPLAIHAALRDANPAPFSGLMYWRDAALCCSSPERLLCIDNGMAQTRPIAGTRRRSRGTDDDMTRKLLAHPKERAEHVMLIDLERNDLGRICRPGTIDVDELMVTESYAHVHHIVSNIRGQLRAGVGPGAALAAVFPGGTITGCPKVRCMEIIAALEGQGRGAYTGSIGYLSRCGRLDSNIIIRSLTQRGRQLTLRTGAGIVADSSASKELEETRIKARGVLRSFIDDRGLPYG